MYALIDCNNFYVSCERLFAPSLNTRPVIVLSNNDGCAISRSDEAKQIGIKMGASPHLIKELLRQHAVKIFSSNYELYGDLSDRVMKTLQSFVPHMEIYSIDEAFLDLSGIPPQQHYQLASTIRETIRQHFNIPTCIGIAPTKTLAKMANRFAKKASKLNPLYHAIDEQSISAMLADTKVEDIWGVGQQYAVMLRNKNIFSALDFIRTPEKFIRATMSVTGLRIHKELNGIPCLELKTQPVSKKIIGSSRSFGVLVRDKKIIRQALADYAAIAAGKLRAQQSVAGSIKVFIHTNPYRVQDEQYYQSVVVEMDRGSNNTADIIRHASSALDLIFREGFNYLKCGIELGKIVPQNQVQLSLFPVTAHGGKENIARLSDSINHSFGKELVKLGSQGTRPLYKARAAHVSGCCTTRFEELPVIKI